jgi:hypothetical protein
MGGGIAALPPSLKISLFVDSVAEAPLCLAILSKHFKAKNHQDCSAVL